MTKKTLILSGFILTKFLLQYVLYNPHYELHRDEYLHLDQAQHLAWGYLSVPPVTSWISYIILLFGNSIFWIKFFPALFGALTILMVWKTIEALKGNVYALVLGSTCILLSSLLRINFLYQPNSLDILCWTAFYYSIIKYFGNDKQKWLYLAAVIFAVGFLNKYNIIFCLAALIPAIMITRQRQVFGRKGIYYAAAVAILCISPNLYWQYANGFPVFKHLKELADTQLVHVNRLVFLKEQVFYFIGALPVIIAGLYALLFYEPYKKYRAFFWSFLLTLSIFIVLKAKGYYAIGLYPIYISFGAAYLGEVLHGGWKRQMRLVLMGIPVLFYILLYNVFYTIEDPDIIQNRKHTYQKLGLLRWEDGQDYQLPQDFADMLGWKELATKVEKVYKTLPAESNTIILCDNYGQAGAINYYVKDKRIKAVSFNADYINWFGLERKIDNFIRIKESDGSRQEFTETSPYFGQAFIADSVTNSLAREYKTTIFVFTAPKIDINKRLKAEIEMTKKH
jgi:hypothetical protein